MPLFRQSVWLGHVIAIALPTALIALIGLLAPGISDVLLVAIFVAAILIASFLGDWLAGVTATAVSTAGVAVIHWQGLSTLDREAAYVAASVLLVGTLVCVLIGALRRTTSQPKAHALRLRAVRESVDERFSIVFNSAPVAIMLTRISDGCIVDVNAAFTELWKYTRAEVIGRTSSELDLWIAPTRLIERLKADRYSDVKELQIRRKGGEPRAVLASVTMIHVDGNAHLLVTAADATERNRAREFEHLAHHDTLTQLPNRLLLLDRLREIQARGTTSPLLSAVLFLDLDEFKAVNDSFGHRAGDELLRLVAARLAGRLRQQDLLARLGGDEFVVVLEDIQDRKQALSIANDLLTQISSPFVLARQHRVQIGASIGISYLTRECGDIEMLIQEADAALYAAKHAGRNAVRVFDEAAREAVMRTLSSVQGKCT